MKLFTKLSTLLLCGVAVAVIGCSDLQEDIQGVDVKVENLEKTTSSSIAELQSAIDALKAANAALENQKADKTALDAAKADLQAAFDKKLAEVNAAVSALTAVVDGKASAEDVAALSTKLDEAVKALEATIANIEAALGEKADKDDVDAIAGDVDILKNGYAQTVEALTNIQGVLEGKASQEDVDGIVADLNTLKTGYAQTVEALTNTQGALATLNGNFEDLSAVVETLKTGYAQTVAALTNLNGRMDAIEGRVETLESEVKKLQAAYADLEARLQKTLTDMQAKDEAYETAYADLEARLQKVLSDMQAKDEAFENEFSELNKNLQQALTDLQNITAVNAEDIEALKKAHALTTSDLTNLSFAYYQHLEELADYKASVADQLEALELQDATLLKTIQSEIANAQAYADEAVKALEEKQTKALADLEAKINTAWESERALIYNTIYDIQKTLEGAISEGDAAAIIASKDYTDEAIAMVYKTIVDVQATLENFAVVGDQTLKEAFEEQIAGVYKSILDYFNQANGYADAAVAALAAQIEEGLATVYKTIESEIERAEGYADEAVKAAVEELSAEIYKTLSDEIARACGYADEAAKAALEEALPLVYNTIQSNTEQLTGYIDAEIAALKELLAGDFVSAEDLASQIQSITWVPTKDQYNANAIQAYQYRSAASGTYKYSPKMFETSFEVTPAEAVKTLASADLFFSTVALKSGDEITFPAEILDIDEARGQILVRGYFNEESEIYVADAARTDLVALNIVTSNSANVVTNVKGSYVKVKQPAASTPVQTLFTFYNVATKKEVSSLENIKVPYNDYNARPLFANIVPAFELNDGRFVAASEAEAYFGFPVKVEYTGVVTTTFAGADVTKNENKAPLYVDGKDFAANAQITTVDVANYDPKTYVGQTATLTIGSFKINGEASAANIKRVFEIDNVVAPAAIIFETAQYDWTPSLGATYTGSWIQDLNVTGTDNIMTTLGLGVTDLVDTFEAERKYTDAEGDEHTETLTADIKIRSKNNVEISNVTYKLDGVSAGVPFGKESAVTYTFTGSKVYNKATYNMSFDLVMGAMPADKVIDLGNLEVDGITDATFLKVSVDPLTKILAADGAAFGSDVKLNTLPTSVTTTAVEINGVEDTQLSHFYFSLGTATTDGVTTETSQIFIHKSQVKYDDVVAIEASYVYGGITYTIKANVEVLKPNYSIVPNTTYVDANGVVTLGGQYTIGSSTVAKKDFVLDKIVLSDYVKTVNVPTAYASLVDLKYTLKSELTDEQKAAGYKLPKDINNTTDVLTWADGGVASRLQSVVYEIALVNATDNTIVYGEPVTVTLNIPTFVDMKAATPYSVDYEAGKISTVCVAKSIKAVNATKTTEALSNAIANVSTFDDLNDLAKTNTDAYNVFGQVYSIVTVDGKAQVTFTNADGTEATLNGVSVNTATGEITIGANNGHITGDITITVKVQMTQMYDSYVADTETVTITLEKK